MLRQSPVVLQATPTPNLGRQRLSVSASPTARTGQSGASGFETDQTAAELADHFLPVPLASSRKWPVSGEWTTQEHAAELLAERQAQLFDERTSELQFWRKWRTRASFDVWRRQYTRTNRGVLMQLHRVSTQLKGKTAEKRRALMRWVAVCDMQRRREIKRLQKVADVRLSLLMSGIAETKDPLKPTRQIATRWSRPIAYKTFNAWRRWSAEPCQPRP